MHWLTIVWPMAAVAIRMAWQLGRLTGAWLKGRQLDRWSSHYCCWCRHEWVARSRISRCPMCHRP